MCLQQMTLGGSRETGAAIHKAGFEHTVVALFWRDNLTILAVLINYSKLNDTGPSSPTQVHKQHQFKCSYTRNV